MNVAEHLELHLGPMERGWASSSFPGVLVCLFRDRPVAGAFTLGTLGLSNTVLAMPLNRLVRQELLLACSSDSRLEELARLLIGTAELALQSGRALLRGQVIPAGDHTFPGSRADSLHASIPVVYPEAVATLADTTPKTVVVRLIPLHTADAAFVRSSGWSKFEDRLEAADPDLLDPRRKSIL